MRDALKLINWNVNRAAPRSKHSRGVEIVRRIERHSPEIVCLTEAHPELLTGGHKISAGIQESPRKVLLWSREPWKREDTVGDARMPPGRFVSGVTHSVGEVTVVGLCIPWERSRVKAGHRRPWDDHKVFLEHLAAVLARAPAQRLIVVGDFNQSGVLSSRPRPESDAARRAALLHRAMPHHVTPITFGRECCGLTTIDHIALSADLSAKPLEAISNVHGERELSDPRRCGFVADILVRGS